ncbi:MAG: hypothetical protein ABEJ58_01750 [Halodesulfurarchaeum sp.]
MDRSRATVTGWIGTVGAILVVLISVPSGWYGVPATDSYIFDPALLTPLWIQRVVMPLLSIVALLSLLVCLASLVYRDWPVAGRIRRGGGVLGVFGLFGLTIAIPFLHYSSQGVSGVGSLAIIAGFVATVIFGGILAIGLLVLAYGYYSIGRTTLGLALLGVVIGVPVLGTLAPSPFKSLAASLPVAFSWGVIGAELRAHASLLDSEESSETI